MDIKTKLQSLLDANANNTLPEGGLFLERALQQARLDYTPGSLRRIDALINQVREKLKPAEDGFLDDPAKENFALTLAAYLVDYLGRETKDSVTWFTHQDAANVLPPEPKIVKGFATHIVALIENTAVMPLVSMCRLFGDESLTVENFYNEVFGLVKSNQAISEGWKQEYLIDFLSGKAVPGGVAFEEGLPKSKFDFSLESLDVLDRIIFEIKMQINPDFSQWMNTPALCNFLYLMGTYLGATTARQANCFLKWLNYEQTKALLPATPHTFGTSFNALFGTGTLMHPVAKVCDLLFADDNEINCRGFAERVLLDEGTPAMISLVPGMHRAQQDKGGLFSKLRATPTFDPSWIAPFQEAGFMAASAANDLAEDLPVKPQILQGARPDRKKLVLSMMFTDSWESANEVAMSFMEQNGDGVPFQVYIFDGYANLPLERLDAMYLDIRRYDAPKMSCLLIVPYRPASSPEGLKVYSPKLCNSTISEDLASEVAKAFFAGAKNYKGLNWDISSWDKYFDERM